MALDNIEGAKSLFMRKESCKMKKKWTHLFFIMPGFVMYTIFIVVPILFVFYLSLFEWSGLGEMVFVGLNNFRNILFNDRFAPIFWNALGNNFRYLLAVWFIITPIQYVLAYLFFIKIPFYKYSKLMIFLPFVISSTIVSFFATMIFNPNIGILNSLLALIGLEPSAWLGNPNLSFGIFVSLVIWQSAGVGVMIFYTNFMDISQEIMEASRLDGCSEWQRFFHILLPLSLPACASIIVMSSIWALAVFDIPFLLGGLHGGVSGTLDFANLVFYRFTFGNVLNGRSELGFGAAISVIIFFFMMIIAVVQNKILSKFEFDN